ncbi:bcl-2/adenovirus E1B 19 kDa-interacting protein 2-like protein [Chelmon rostratus]|uniref:bcl-2/adenovirus E1B 19 kDa-interacting protein 2-like protein n=1 Tax=Chelmon rostratus TaxID=109905 RepID=UPI001BEB1B29|nr:bcl-2/adenovirus E1B 19 kDa-interacting protein 2-like protein [Chelmon rostratus]XP_041810694.1 bcl-2/adenovirus E1B 19 kDa-interacting protein 2-like protein [Chelmon rostratus]XP_041810695.1 bcl-2/adenovirus E1B 19 kDa-interacting protein 2-like protein [Chelmon rostratus]
MESREEEQEEDHLRSPLADEDTENIVSTTTTDNTDSTRTANTTTTTAAACSTLTTTMTAVATCGDRTEGEEETGERVRGNSVAMAATGADSADEEVTGEETCPGDEVGEDGEENESIFISSSDLSLPAGDGGQEGDFQPGAVEDKFVSEKEPSTPTRDGPAPPSSLALSRPTKKKVLVAPALSLSLGHSESTVSEEFPSAFLSPSPEDDDDVGLDFDLDAIETPSDSESLPFPIYDLDLEDDLQRLGLASRRNRGFSSSPRSKSDFRTGSGPGTDQSGLGALEREDVIDSQGTRWRCFSTGDPPQESRVDMSVLEPFLRVLSHGGYCGDGMNDIIVFSSCYLPQNSLENYQYVMDHLFRYVVGTLDLMVAENYVIVYLCAGGQTDKLPGISWLKECYTTIDRRLRKNLKGFYVVHPTWYIKALITIIKPFISSKFSRKLQFVDSLQHLSGVVPTEHVQIPDCVAQYDQNLSR